MVIFGGTGGIGSVVARGLHGLGHPVAIAARSSTTVQQLADELGGLALPVDATDFDAVDEAVGRAKSAWGQVGGLVNCVGSILLKPAHRTTQLEYHQTVNANLTSAFSVTRAGGLHLGAGGALVLVSSAAAGFGLPNHEAIAAAKAGVEGLARAAAASYAARGIRVNVVAPGLVDTPLAARLLASESSRKLSESSHPLGRVGRPEDVASAIIWLLDAAQSWVTGQVIGVDGGLATVKGR